MSNNSLANKYRPKEFHDVSAQKSLIAILSRQLETKTFKNCYLFCGPSGTGKTTVARIFANKINQGAGTPIEIDGASNNGVENIRKITDDATERALDAEYKVYIIDECHMITTQGWNAFLKCIEEPPKYTIFIFCTTDPQKMPQTIINRCQVYNLSRIPDDEIKGRLHKICQLEHFDIAQDAVEHITRLSDGSMRQAIVYLDKCKDFSNEITLDTVVDCLGNYSYQTFLDLTNAVIDTNFELIINIIDNIYASGTDLKLFITSYFEFVLQLTKFCVLHSLEVAKIPSTLQKQVVYTTSIENNVAWFNNYLKKLLELKQMIKNDTDIKTTVEVMLMNIN